MAHDSAKEIEELKYLQSFAKMPGVASLLSAEILKREKLANDSTSCQTQAQIPAPISKGITSQPAPSLNYAPLGSFSWDQTDKEVKIYVPLENVHEDKIQAEFKKTSYDVKIHDVQGKNYRCAIPKLNKEIVPVNCRVITKPKRIIISLSKASHDNWSDLQPKEDKLKPGLDKEKDPMAGIMDLMKNMYEEGDDEMKRTIAKAWTDARSGKHDDPMKRFG